MRVGQRGSAGVLSAAVLSAGSILCLLAYWPAFDRQPRFFDYDDASQGIFTNDLSFHGDYVHSFRNPRDDQDLYRSNWAAQRLPFSFGTSLLQRALGIPRHAVEDLLRGLTLAFGAAGSLLAALCLAAPPRRLVAGVLPVLALTAAHPSYILFLRTGTAYYLLAFALFWAACFAAVRFGESRRPAALYALAGVLAVGLLNPYPPLVCLPLVLPALLWLGGGLRPALASPHLYAAGAAALLLATGVAGALALSYEGSLGSFLGRLLEFQRDRGHSISLAQWSDWSLGQKLAKLANQHLLSRFDRLGDWSREDEVWTMGVPNWALVCAAPLMVYGAWRGLRSGEAAAQRAAVVAAGLLLVFLSVSFPEGRYLLALIPCYAFFLVRGVGELVRGAAARRLALGALLLAIGAHTHYNLVAVFGPFIEAAWRPNEGMREAAPIAARFEEPTVLVRTPHRTGNFKRELYFRMVMPPGARWVDDIEAGPPGARRLAVEYAERGKRVAALEARGYARVAELPARGSGRPLVVLTRPPSPGAQPARTQPARARP